MVNSEKQSAVVNLDRARNENDVQTKPTVYRFDIFKGIIGDDGKVTKVKSVGAAYIREGFRTYTVHLKTFLKDAFFLLPNSKESQAGDFVILTREPAVNSGRKYFWNNVGFGEVLDGVNRNVMRLSWDVLASDLYMELYPANVTELPEASNADAAA